jgi:hydroxymethylpyrimidine/phosphomethylpyrimidine kinase
MEVNDRASMEEAARRIKTFGPAYVIVKGGHLPHEACDLLFDGRSFRMYTAPKINTICTHGAGCTFSAAITAGLAKGLEVPEAVATAKAFITRAMSAGFAIGKGHAPLNHRAGFSP